MKVTTITGGEQSCIRFSAETVTECVDLMRVYTSPFLKQDDTRGQIFLNLQSTIELGIYIGDPKRMDSNEMRRINAEHDSMP